MSVLMQEPNQSSPLKRRAWLITSAILVLILLAGTFLRFRGLLWGEFTDLHPDERFLLWVGTDISPVENLAAYWDTANSSLNPHNRGHGFYVYGTLPMFLTRYMVEWIYGHSGFREMAIVGRTLSAVADLFTVLLVYLIGARVYNRRVGLIAAALSAFAVLQIQHAHFFTMDSFTTTFAMLTIYFAARVAYEGGSKGARGQGIEEQAIRDKGIGEVPEGWDRGTEDSWRAITSNPLFMLSIGFGVALGMAVASKVNAAPLALLLPTAIVIRIGKIKGEEVQRQARIAIVYLILAAAVSLFIFRISQPYAFSGPGFFGLKPNPAWVANLNELRVQATGDVDFPPALQWARRPVWFALQNMVLWGMGLPMGLAVWAGFLWIGWRILKGEWRSHILLWAWTALYFTWQSLIFNPSMRYQLLVYPTLAIFAGWGLVRLIDGRRSTDDERHRTRDGRVLFRIAGVILTVVVLGTTAVYAFAFSNIYVEPLTRVEASRWIYQNIPGPINLHIQTGEGTYSQPLPFYFNSIIRQDIPFLTSFVPLKSGTLTELGLGRVIDPGANFGDKEITVAISENPDGGGTLTQAGIKVGYYPDESQSTNSFAASIQNPVQLIQGQEYSLQLDLPIGQGPINLFGSVDLIQHSDPVGVQSIPLPGIMVDSMIPFSPVFIAEKDWIFDEIRLNLQSPSIPSAKTLNFSISSRPDGAGELGSTQLTSDFQFGTAPGTVTIKLSQPLPVEAEVEYYLTISLSSPEGVAVLRGAAMANEGAWDDGLPVRIDRHDPYSGIYIPGLNFDMYEDDNPNKLSRFYNILDNTEYLLISSSRQWGTLPRLPERFPMNSEYYRSLIGCPVDRSIEWCFNVAQPGTFQGDLGFDLIQVFDSNPSIGSFEINDQSSEEAFTVYDHPKVFIFQKRADYNPDQVRSILGAVDLSKVVHVTPKKAGSLPRDMMLPADRLASQYAGSTWSELFNVGSLLNRIPAAGLVIWYLVIAILGILAYPIVRFALPGLSDRGYPLSRIAGLLLLSYPVWLAGSFQIPFSRITITLVFFILAIAGVALAYRQRSELAREWREKRNYFLLIEGLFLAFFSVDLLIRLGNPDLWHPWMGGERPMDFSYFNAVLKSSTFPPYDPWFTGGYINYYYFGFVLVGVPVKWLGIVPAIAYNLIIPTIFSTIAMGAFSIGWNLFNKDEGGRMKDEIRNDLRPSSAVRHPSSLIHHPSSFIAGIAAALSLAVLGNLGTVRMIYQGYQRLAAPGGAIEGANILTRLIWAARGALMTLAGDGLPYALRDWYWLPSRAIPAPNDVEPITEFPFFTVLYGDPHAHLFALPLTLLALSWALSVVLSRAWKPEENCTERRSILQICVSIFLGALAIGALWPTNTWDYPTFLGLGVLGAGYAIWRQYRPLSERKSQAERGVNSPGESEVEAIDGPAKASTPNLPVETKRILLVLGGALSLAAVSFILYRPYSEWYVQGYTDVGIWKGTHTPFWSYLTHWGAFLFLILSWMIWETREWMANTPLSTLRKLEPYKGLLSTTGILLLLLIVVLQLLGAAITWFVLPIAVWAMILLIRPGMPVEKRAVLVMVALSLVLTLSVEVVVLVGDIGRMNTVFKFYLQVWTMFSLSAALSFSWLLAASARWLPGWKTTWQAVVLVLVFATGLYPLLGSLAKIRDRMSLEAPHTLDGMAFMRYSRYDDLGVNMDLSQDYRAIKWFQENIPGSPVIIEGNMVEYHWGTRFTIYTGLPNVIGWNWHQRQQRARAPEYVIPERLNDVTEFYTTTVPDRARNILEKYQVEYVIVGQLEKALYSGQGLDKFEQLDGAFWREVYRDGETVIYQVTG